MTRYWRLETGMLNPCLGTARVSLHDGIGSPNPYSHVGSRIGVRELRESGVSLGGCTVATRFLILTHHNRNPVGR